MQVGWKRRTITFCQLKAFPPPIERVHAPVGLDIGAITPEEIAVAITAELIAVRRRAERALPHMSWFKGRTSEPTTDTASEAHEENESHR